MCGEKNYSIYFSSCNTQKGTWDFFIIIIIIYCHGKGVFVVNFVHNELHSINIDQHRSKIARCRRGTLVNHNENEILFLLWFTYLSWFLFCIWPFKCKQVTANREFFFVWEIRTETLKEQTFLNVSTWTKVGIFSH